MGYVLMARAMRRPKQYCIGTKLYGYVPAEGLRSLQYLWELGAFNDEDAETPDDLIWDYGMSHTISLTAKEFEKFAELYEQDDAEWREKIAWKNIVPDFSEILKIPGRKEISWG